MLNYRILLTKDSHNAVVGYAFIEAAPYDGNRYWVLDYKSGGSHTVILDFQNGVVVDETKNGSSQERSRILAEASTLGAQTYPVS